MMLLISVTGLYTGSQQRAVGYGVQEPGYFMEPLN